ncbi:type 2 periplasmic-binding domain-containing protein [Nocardia terpenica]|uniref:hypothetical protein n=1 Tax=Nocardia terpenica TaxID=455432 RepID=UPI0018E07F14|nr:hypothetical protein [Nocardia terpenica]
MSHFGDRAEPEPKDLRRDDGLQPTQTPRHQADAHDERSSPTSRFGTTPRRPASSATGDPRLADGSSPLLGLISYVASGSCVCLVPEQLARQTLPTVRFVPLRDSSRYLETRIAAIHRTDAADAAVRRVIDLIDRRRPRDGADDGR